MPDTFWCHGKSKIIFFPVEIVYRYQGKSNKDYGDKSRTIDFSSRFTSFEKFFLENFHGTKLYLAPKCLLRQSVSCIKVCPSQSVHGSKVSRSKVSLAPKCLLRQTVLVTNWAGGKLSRRPSVRVKLSRS